MPKELTLKEKCKKTTDELLLICQDRTACSVIRPVLSDIPTAKIQAMRYLPNRWDNNEDLLFLVAGLIATHPCQSAKLDEDEDDKSTEFQSFGQSLYRLSKHPDVNEKGIEHRFQLLLQLERESLSHTLHSLVEQAKKPGTYIDYAALLYHLHSWNNPKKWVQMKWAEDYYWNSSDNFKEDQDGTP
jgi:CRISPR type I-E-associated protein CasB/Cse2